MSSPLENMLASSWAKPAGPWILSTSHATLQARLAELSKPELAYTLVDDLKHNKEPRLAEMIGRVFLAATPAQRDYLSKSDPGVANATFAWITETNSGWLGGVLAELNPSLRTYVWLHLPPQVRGDLTRRGAAASIGEVTHDQVARNPMTSRIADAILYGDGPIPKHGTTLTGKERRHELDLEAVDSRFRSLSAGARQAALEEMYNLSGVVGGGYHSDMLYLLLVATPEERRPLLAKIAREAPDVFAWIPPGGKPRYNAMMLELSPEERKALGR